MIMISSFYPFERSFVPDVALRGLSPGLHQALKEAAEKNHRSLNGEILARLEQSLRPAPLDVRVLMARVKARRSRLGALALDEDGLRRLKDSGRP